MANKSGAVETGAAPEKGLTAAAIARDWQMRQGTSGPSRAYVSTCIKRGCPATSFEAAWAWRVENAKYGVGHRSKRAPGAPAPVTSVPISQIPREETMRPPPIERDGPPEPVESLQSLEDSLAAAINMEGRAYWSATSLGTEAAIRAYNNARDGRFEAERSYREEMERRKILVPMRLAMDLGRKGYDVLMPALRALGSRIGGDVSPENPVRAADVIDREITVLLAQAKAAYGDIAA